MKKSRVIVFDFDGTIANTLEVFVDGFNLFSKRKVTKNNWRKEFKFDHISNLKTFKVDPKHGKTIWDYYAKQSPKLIPGIKKLINDLSKTYIVVIASNTNKDLVKKIIKKHNLSIKYIVNSNKSKPNPQLLNNVKKLTKKKDIIYIGDTSVDIQTTKNAKGISIGFFTNAAFHYLYKIKGANPDYLARSASEIKKILKQIENNNSK